MSLRRLVSLSVFAPLLVSCSGGDSPADPPVPTSISLSATSIGFTVLGATRLLTATVKDQNGATILGASVTWSSSNGQVARVSPSGMVTSVANGTATITASSGSALGTVEVAVQQVAATITLSPSSLSFQSIGAVQQLTATVKDQAGSTFTTAVVSWSSSDLQVASVFQTGLVLATGQGTASVSALSGPATASAQVTVHPTPQETVAVTPIVGGR
jgi:uncharacterized protein YjdB